VGDKDKSKSHHDSQDVALQKAPGGENDNIIK
jgi:hypothetical protein